MRRAAMRVRAMGRRAKPYTRAGKTRVAAVAKQVLKRFSTSNLSKSKNIRKKSYSFSGAPKFSSSVGGSVTISHRECVGTVSSMAQNNAGYKTFHPAVLGSSPGESLVNGLVLYPTNVKVFPWLASIAGRFEQYQWKHIEIQFVTALADSGTTATANLGNLMAFVEYEPNKKTMPGWAADNTFGKSNNFMNQFGCMSTKPSQGFQLGVQSHGNPFELKWTTNTPDAQEEQVDNDPRFLADGRLFIACDNCPTGNSAGGDPASLVGITLGYLYVNYSIELVKPQV
jgi:hypothetical protein